MEDQRILVDTSIIIEHLRLKDKTKSVLYRILDKYHLTISAITFFELQAGATTSQKENDILEILSVFDVRDLPFTMDVAKKAGEIYRNNKARNQLLDMRDLFIGATALTYDLPIVTLNQKHFDRIANLNLIDI